MRKTGSRDVGIFELKRYRRGNFLDAIENISASGANRGHFSGRCPVSRELRRDIISVSPRALAARRRSAIQRKRKVFPKREGKQPERVSPLSLVRLCLLSPHSESRFPPNRRKLTVEISRISPKAKNGYWQIISIIFPRAKWTVDFVRLPSCQEGRWFR